MPHAPRTLWLAPLGLSLLASCVPAVTIEDQADPEALSKGEKRTVELRYLRLDAKGFAQTLTKADIKARFPERILRETWLLDMPIEPLIENALNILVDTPEDVAYTLEPSSLNMWKLLNMTPANTVLTGSSLEGLLGIGEAVGLPPSLVLSDLIGIPTNEGIISVALTKPIIIDHVVSTHPNAQWRRAPAGSTCPDGEPETSGLCRVAHASMPVSLWDVVTDFQDLAVTFGPASDPFDPSIPRHPGFVQSASPIVAATDEFEMTVRVNLNALPYKGVDLGTARIASVNSTESQVADAFDFSKPDWMEIKGLVDNLVIDEMVMAIHENEDYIPSGDSQTPAPKGNSPVWDLPLWQFERLIAQVALVRAETIESHCKAYPLEGEVDMPYEAIQVCIGEGAYLTDMGQSCDFNDHDPACTFDPTAEVPPNWVSLAVDPIVKLDELPPQSYFWDILLEVAQLRLHDSGLAEGKADIAFALQNIAAGISTAELETKIRDNIQANPAALSAIAELLNENTEGDADFYYYHASLDAPPEQRGDWLYFITDSDIKNTDLGDPVRPYDYPSPGFFADAKGKMKVSDTVALDGDTTHEKVRIKPGDVLYAQDADKQVFKIEVNDKPDRHIVSLTIERVR